MHRQQEKPSSMVFNPQWIDTRRNCFADGWFQGVKVDVQHIECEHDNLRFAAKTRPSFWTQHRVDEMEQQYKTALDVARGRSL